MPTRTCDKLWCTTKTHAGQVSGVQASAVANGGVANGNAQRPARQSRWRQLGKRPPTAGLSKRPWKEGLKQEKTCGRPAAAPPGHMYALTLCRKHRSVLRCARYERIRAPKGTHVVRSISVRSLSRGPRFAGRLDVFYGGRNAESYPLLACVTRRWLRQERRGRHRMDGDNVCSHQGQYGQRAAAG